MGTVLVVVGVAIAVAGIYGVVSAWRPDTTDLEEVGAQGVTEIQGMPALPVTPSPTPSVVRSRPSPRPSPSRPSPSQSAPSQPAPSQPSPETQPVPDPTPVATAETPARRWGLLAGNGAVAVVGLLIVLWGVLG